MNTPSRRKRYAYEPPKGHVPDGQYTSGVHNRDFAAALGSLISFWPHVEEQMIFVFADLTGSQDRDMARQIFRSIVSQKARLDIMRRLLETAPAHAQKEKFYDDTLSEFSALNRARNSFAHGLWFTHDETHQCYFQEELDGPHQSFTDARKVELAELDACIDRGQKLVMSVIRHYYLKARAVRESSKINAE